jgi:hypothetical protein
MKEIVMRRFSVLVVIGVLATVAALGLVTAIADAQAGTPSAIATHPLVGTWIVDGETGAGDAPTLTSFTADGIVIDTGAGPVLSGTWQATGPRTATFIAVGVVEDEGGGGSFFIRAEIDVDAAGETWTAPYSWTDVAADGTVLETGQDTASGTRLVIPSAETAGASLPGFPIWTPMTSEGGAPEAATPVP